ncbi:GNAT family N-acetyltransferase [Qaidamihabitans albus]|uniref:GNAT family N-acetyltransferase n=1 Tax=Qaidamihabitans albus TaxID=2795733 RepID=UPI0027DDF722|nr:GNAT family N-acetyltransferase [Qaidamihabitans albus]
MDLTIEPVRPHAADAVTALRRYFTEIVGRYHGRQATEQEVDAAIADEPSDDLRPPSGLLLLARRDGETVGCAGLRLLRPETAELTRLYVDREARGLGLGERLVRAVEEAARELGARFVRLDTRRDLVEARTLYARLGYREIPAYNDGKYADHWFEKRLSPAPTPPARRPSSC